QCRVRLMPRAGDRGHRTRGPAGDGGRCAHIIRSCPRHVKARGEGRRHMLLKTDRFGEIRIAQEDIIHFPDGLLGFEELHRYVVVERERKGPIRFLQAVDDGRIAFAVTDPQTFRPDYLPELGEEDRAALQYESDEDLAVLVILTVPQEVREMTANLMAPVIINVKERIGR